MSTNINTKKSLAYGGAVYQSALLFLLFLLPNLYFSKQTSFTNEINLSDSSAIGYSQPAKIHISGGAEIVSVENFYNVKIFELQKTKKPKKIAEKVTPKKKPVGKAIRKEIKKENRFAYQNSTKDFSFFSQNQTEQIFFSQDRTQHFFKMLLCKVFSLTISFSHSIVQSISYQNPYIVLCQFSGRYLVRPPTSFS